LYREQKKKEKKIKKKIFLSHRRKLALEQHEGVLGTTIPLISCIDEYSEKSNPQNIISLHYQILPF